VREVQQQGSLASACEELAAICESLLPRLRALPGERVAAAIGPVMLLELQRTAPVAREFAKASRSGTRFDPDSFELEVLVPHASMLGFAPKLPGLDRGLAPFQKRIEALKGELRTHWKRLTGESPVPIPGGGA
jgi:hypothetical protein